MKTRLPLLPLLLRTAREHHGTELFEFALVMPLVLMSLFGIIWLGRGYNVYQTITRAAREGARHAVLPNCATCGNTYADTYISAGACLTNPTNVFTNHVSPALAASNLDPSQVSNYCQRADWLEGTSPRQCGVIVSFSYPVQVTIPFTPLNAQTLNISTQARMRFENISVDSNGNTVCP